MTSVLALDIAAGPSVMPKLTVMPLEAVAESDRTVGPEGVAEGIEGDCLRGFGTAHRGGCGCGQIDVVGAAFVATTVTVPVPFSMVRLVVLTICPAPDSTA